MVPPQIACFLRVLWSFGACQPLRLVFDVCFIDNLMTIVTV